MDYTPLMARIRTKEDWERWLTSLNEGDRSFVSLLVYATRLLVPLIKAKQKAIVWVVDAALNIKSVNSKIMNSFPS